MAERSFPLLSKLINFLTPRTPSMIESHYQVTEIDVDRLQRYLNLRAAQRDQRITIDEASELDEIVKSDGILFSTIEHNAFVRRLERDL